MSNEPFPQRMSDADRDAAIAMLREHFEAGRLDQTEFGDRLERALTARYPADLAPVFADLPDPRPDFGAHGSPPPPSQPAPWETPTWSGPPFPQTQHAMMEPRPGAPMPSTQQNWLPMARKIIWPVAIVLGIVTDAFMLWIVIAIVASIVLGQMENRTRKPPPYLGS